MSSGWGRWRSRTPSRRDRSRGDGGCHRRDSRGSTSRRNRSPPTRQADTGYDGDADAAVRGVEVNIVRGEVPVVNLDKSSVFHENVSWMLQTALGSTGKVENLYEYDDDRGIMQECEEILGLTAEDVGIVRLRREDLRGVKAVGTNGKRSIMFACVVALAIREDFMTKDAGMAAMLKELAAYKLTKPFLMLLRNAQYAMAKHRTEASGGAGRVADASEEPADGVELEVVQYRRSYIPVLGLDKASIFHENVSWMLQTAMASTGKADALYTYSEDPGVVSQCRKLGLTAQDIGLVRIKKEELSHIMAVGTSGKRSVMLAVVVALIMHDNVDLAEMMSNVQVYDEKMEKPFIDLARQAAQLAGKPAPSLSDFGVREDSLKSKSGGSRDKGDWSSTGWSNSDSYDYGSSGRKSGGGRKGDWGGSAKPRKAAPERPNQKSMDDELDAYFADSPQRTGGNAPSKSRNDDDDWSGKYR